MPITTPASKSTGSVHPSNQHSPVPNFFHAGFPKTATTWLHRCLQEHPDVVVPTRDAVHVLTCRYHSRPGLYQPYYEGYSGQESIIADTTPSYAAFSWSRRRMAEVNPHAKVLITLRNPIDRAWSQYWHHKQKREAGVTFEAALERYADLYSWWIATGFYFEHISDLLTLFPRDQICFGFHDDIRVDPLEFCQTVFGFLQIDDTFVPSCVHDRINTHRSRQPRGLMGRLRKYAGRLNARPTEYERGMKAATRRHLCAIYRRDVECLSDLLNRDLTGWLEV